MQTKAESTSPQATVQSLRINSIKGGLAEFSAATTVSTSPTAKTLANALSPDGMILTTIINGKALEQGTSTGSPVATANGSRRQSSVN